MGAEKLTQESRSALLRECGLMILDDPIPSGIPGVLEAWQPVVNIAAEPAAKVSLSSPTVAAEVDKQWHVHAVRNSIISPKGDFLISIAGTGSIELGWALVRYSADAKISSRLIAHTGASPEFLAMSLDGRRVCGVTPEE